MLFNGGLVPQYMMWTRIFRLKNTYLALLLPNLMLSAMNVILIRNYFKTNIPMSLIEAAELDGAGEFRIYLRVVLPLSKPIIATVGLFTGLGYWNDWTNGLYYITDEVKYSIQTLLNRILNDIQFLSQMYELGGGANVGVNLPTAAARMAIAVIAVLPILLVFPFFQKFFVKGITIGAVKG